MVGHRARRRARESRAAYVVIFALVASVTATALAAPPDRVDGLTGILAAASIVAGLMSAGAKGGMGVSASFITFALAAVFLGPRSAMAAAFVSELVAALLSRTSVR